MNKPTNADLSRQIETVAQTVVRIEARVETLHDEMATKDDIARLEDKIESGLGNRQQELDELRDRMRVLETRMDKLEVAHQ